MEQVHKAAAEVPAADRPVVVAKPAEVRAGADRKAVVLLAAAEQPEVVAPRVAVVRRAAARPAVDRRADIRLPEVVGKEEAAR